MKSAGHAQLIAAAAVHTLGAELPVSKAHTALQMSLITRPDAMAPELLERLRVVLA